MGQLVDLSVYRNHRKSTVYFTRRELNMLFGLFSRRVLVGEWRDYTIDNGEGFAAFCVYRRTNDAPLFTIMRLAEGGNAKGDYLVMQGGQSIRQGRTLHDVISGFAPPLRAVRS
jgi:hypothetical protein